jgi:hypothetical protein
MTSCRKAKSPREGAIQFAHEIGSLHLQQLAAICARRSRDSDFKGKYFG